MPIHNHTPDTNVNRTELSYRWTKPDLEKKTKEYKAWYGLKYLCGKNNPNHAYFYDKGITVHPDFTGERGYANFLAAVGRKPQGTILGRIDKSVGFSPGNVRWMTFTEHVNSRSKEPFKKRFGGVTEEMLIEELAKRGYNKVKLEQAAP